MKRQTVNAWALLLEGKPPEQELGAIDQDDSTLITSLRSDLGIDSLLRANCRKFNRSDEELFVHAVRSEILARHVDEPIVQAVTNRIVRQRSARRPAALGAVATLLIAVFAVGAWYFGETSVRRKKNATSIVQNDKGAITSSALPPAPRPSTAAPTITTKQQRTSLVILGQLPPTTSDALVVQRLLSLGFTSTLRLPSTMDLSKDLRVDLIAISSTVESADMSGPICQTLSATPVPLVVWEPWLFDDLGLADCPHNNGCGWVVAGGSLNIVNHGHPLLQSEASKLDATTAPTVLSFGVPKPSAKVIATIESVQTLQALFVYERGDALSFGPAPARRVALFLSDDTARKLTTEGWEIFDLSIAWALGDIRPAN